MLLDYKYYAGLVDSDGSVGYAVNKLSNETYVIRPSIEITQKDSSLLEELSETYDVKIYFRKETGVSRVRLVGDKARHFLENIRKHSVLKQDLIEYVLVNDKTYCSKEELKVYKTLLKDQRKLEQTRKKSKVSMRWFSGYFDGDGYIGARITNGYLRIYLQVTSWVFDPDGVELLQKNFGGRLHSHKNFVRWTLERKDKSFAILLRRLAKHSRIKKNQLLLCAMFIEKGYNLKRFEDKWPEFLKTLKSLRHPQRLSEEASKDETTV